MVTAKLYTHPDNGGQVRPNGLLWWKAEYIEDGVSWHHSSVYHTCGDAAVGLATAMAEEGVAWDKWDVPKDRWDEAHKALHDAGLLPSQHET